MSVTLLETIDHLAPSSVSSPDVQAFRDYLNKAEGSASINVREYLLTMDSFNDTINHCRNEEDVVRSTRRRVSTIVNALIDIPPVPAGMFESDDDTFV